MGSQSILVTSNSPNMHIGECRQEEIKEPKTSLSLRSLRSSFLSKQASYRFKNSKKQTEKKPTSGACWNRLPTIDDEAIRNDDPIQPKRRKSLFRDFPLRQPKRKESMKSEQIDLGIKLDDDIFNDYD
jgi:hypothetical protein